MLDGGVPKGASQFSGAEAPTKVEKVMSKICELNVDEAHAHCTGNEEALQTSKLAGCFHCCKTYPPADVREWIRENDDRKTAICPKCGIDSVLPLGDESAEACTPFLKAMEKRWFKRVSVYNAQGEYLGTYDEE